MGVLSYEVFYTLLIRASIPFVGGLLCSSMLFYALLCCSMLYVF